MPEGLKVVPVRKKGRQRLEYVAETQATPAETPAPSLGELPDAYEIREWLLSKGVAAWGRVFTTVPGKPSLDEATTWVQEQIASFVEFRSGRA